MLGRILAFVLDHPLMVLAFLYWIFSGFKKAIEERRAKAGPPAPPPPPVTPTRTLPAPPPLPSAVPAPTPRATLSPPAPAPSALSPELARSLELAGQTLAARRARAQASLAAHGPASSLDGLVAAIDALARKQAELVRRAREPGVIADGGATMALRRECAALVQGADALGLALPQRESRLLGGSVPLAERVMRGILTDRAASAQADRAASAPPIVAIVGDGLPVESAARSLLPVAFPVVPRDLGEHPWRWAFVVREAWLQRFTRDAALEGEIASMLSAVDPDLWEDQEHRLASALTGAWATELAADAATALLLGPAWARALIHDAKLRPPASIFAVRTDAAPLPAGYHVPTDLRVAVVLAVLDRAGAPLEAEEMRRIWDAEIPKPATMPLRAPTGVVLVPRDIFLDHADLLAERVMETPIARLRGTIARAAAEARRGPKQGLSGLEANARMLRDNLEDIRDAGQGTIGIAAQDAPLEVVLAALAGLRFQRGESRSLREAGEDAIARSLGGQQAPATTAAARGVARGTRVGRARAIQQALALGEILTPRHLVHR